MSGEGAVVIGSSTNIYLQLNLNIYISKNNLEIQIQATPALVVSGTCVDDDESCPLLASDGLCTHSVTMDSMKEKCKKSCNFCNAGKKCTHYHI